MPTFPLGWFDMETMMTFKRLSSLTQDPSVVLMALAKSSNDLLQASDILLLKQKRPWLILPFDAGWKLGPWKGSSSPKSQASIAETQRSSKSFNSGKLQLSTKICKRNSTTRGRIWNGGKSERVMVVLVLKNALFSISFPSFCKAASNMTRLLCKKGSLGGHFCHSFLLLYSLFFTLSR